MYEIGVIVCEIGVIVCEMGISCARWGNRVRDGFHRQTGVCLKQAPDHRFVAGDREHLHAAGIMFFSLPVPRLHYDNPGPSFRH